MGMKGKSIGKKREEETYEAEEVKPLMKTLQGFRTPFKYRTSFIFLDKFKQGWFLVGVVVFVGCLIVTIYELQ